MPCAPEPVASLETQLHALTIRVQLDQPVVDAARHAPAVVAASTLPWSSPIPQAQTENFVVPLSNHPQDSRSRRTSPSDAPAAAAAPQLHPNSGTLQESLSPASTSKPIEEDATKMLGQFGPRGPALVEGDGAHKGTDNHMERGHLLRALQNGDRMGAAQMSKHERGYEHAKNALSALRLYLLYTSRAS